MDIAYRGTAYAGWQRQENALTVQEVVEGALTTLAGHPVTVAAASRTDAGVHARGQVAHADLRSDLPPRALVHGTIPLLADDVRIVAAAPCAAEFHARFDARGKEYRYRLVRADVLSPLDALFAARADPALDLAAMREATAAVVGRHDLSAFALAGGAHTDPHRTMQRAEWTEQGAVLELCIAGDGFLRGMVRGLVGTLIEVGLGRRRAGDLAALLESGRTRGAAGPTAPPAGLCLERVFYE
jgi:tRNA pseudouridine38-40 synthase